MTAFHKRHSVSLKLTMSLKASWLTVWRRLNKTRIRVHLLKWYNMQPGWLNCPSSFKSISETSNESWATSWEKIFAGQSDVSSRKRLAAVFLSSCRRGGGWGRYPQLLGHNNHFCCVQLISCYTLTCFVLSDCSRKGQHQEKSCHGISSTREIKC